MEVLILVAAVLILILLNGIFAMSEIAIVSSSKTRLRQLQEHGKEGAGKACELAEEPNRFLSTTQIGITLVGVFSGAFGQATLSRKLAGVLQGVPIVGAYPDLVATAVVVAVITYTTLVLGELVPKRLAMQSPESISAAVARPMAWLSRVTAPLVTLLSASTDFVLRLMGRADRREAPASEAEIRARILRGAEEGVLERTESDLAANMLKLDDERLPSVMRPRSEIPWIDVSAPPGRDEIRRLLTEHPYSGILVARRSLDDVMGVLNVREWLAEGENPDRLAEMVQKPLLVYEGRSPLDVLEQFRERGTHTSLVVDEYGNILGMVALDDVFGAVVGYIPRIAQPPDPEVVHRDDGSWLLDGMLPRDRLWEILSLSGELNDEERSYDSLGGLVMAQLRSLPHLGDRFTWRGFEFEVVDMDGNRVDRVLVRPASQERRRAA